MYKRVFLFARFRPFLRISVFSFSLPLFRKCVGVPRKASCVIARSSCLSVPTALPWGVQLARGRRAGVYSTYIHTICIWLGGCVHVSAQLLMALPVLPELSTSFLSRTKERNDAILFASVGRLFRHPFSNETWWNRARVSLFRFRISSPTHMFPSIFAIPKFSTRLNMNDWFSADSCAHFHQEFAEYEF